MVRNARFKLTVPEGGVGLGKPFTVSIGPGTYRGPAEYSIVMSAASYNSQWQFGVLKTESGTKGAMIRVEAKHWGEDWLKTVIPAKTQTFDVLIVVKPAVGPAFVKHIMIPVNLPRLAMLCGRKERAFHANQVIACNVQFRNPLPYSITGAVMTFSISGQSSKSEQIIKQIEAIEPSADAFNTDPTNVDANSRTTFKARFQLNGAVGTQMIVAKFTSNQVDNVSGAMPITILRAPFNAPDRI
jgi:hypothetical protein